jgi:hypothetical protein
MAGDGIGVVGGARAVTVTAARDSAVGTTERTDFRVLGLVASVGNSRTRNWISETAPAGSVELGATLSNSSVEAWYCLAGRKAAAPPATTHTAKARKTTMKFWRRSRNNWRISTASDLLVGVSPA